MAQDTAVQRHPPPAHALEWDSCVVSQQATHRPWPVGSARTQRTGAGKPELMRKRPEGEIDVREEVAERPDPQPKGARSSHARVAGARAHRIDRGSGGDR